MHLRVLQPGASPRGGAVLLIGAVAVVAHLAVVVFQSPRAAHPASGTGGPMLPAPTAINRGAAGSQGCRAIPQGSQHPQRGSPGQQGHARRLSSRHATSQGVQRWCRGCCNGAIPACVEGDLGWAARLNLPRQSQHSRNWRNPLLALCPLLRAFKDTCSSL